MGSENGKSLDKDTQNRNSHDLTPKFTKGMAAQHSNTSSRLRHQCAAIFKVDPLDMLDSQKRKEMFRERIGWVVNEQGSGSYSSVDVEIIHKDSSKEFN